MLADSVIRSLLKSGKLGITVPDEFVIEDSQFQPASFELRLDKRFIRRARTGDSPFVVPFGTSFTLPPGACYLASTIETIKLPPNMYARVEGKSTWGRQFIQIHSTAGFIDPGFPGEVTLEVKNIGEQQVKMCAGDRICQISFGWMEGWVERPYGHDELNSHYVGQRGPTMPHKEALQ